MTKPGCALRMSRHCLGRLFVFPGRIQQPRAPAGRQRFVRQFLHKEVRLFQHART